METDLPWGHVIINASQNTGPSPEVGAAEFTSVLVDHADHRIDLELLAPFDAAYHNHSNNSLGLDPIYYSLEHLIVTSVILGVFILATIIGNCFVIAAIVLEKHLQSAANYLIASLAVADLFVAALVLPLSAVNEVSTHWHLGSELCDMWISIDVLCCTASILHLVAIALDRYWAVTDVNYIHQRKPRRMMFMIAIIWGFSASISIPPLFGWKDNTYKPSETGICRISQDWGYTVYSTALAFYLPLIVILVIYAKVFQAAKSRIRRKQFQGPINSNGLAVDGQKTEEVSTLLPPTELAPVPSTESNSDPAQNNENGNVKNKDVNRNNHHLSVCEDNTSVTNNSPEQNKHRHNLQRMDTHGRLLSPKKWFPVAKKKKDINKERRKIEMKRERRAARTLAIITGSFVVCWLPFFIVAIVGPFCGEDCQIPALLGSIVNWLGYTNSLLNPIIYNIFNPDFRGAFRKIICGRYRRR